MTMPEIESLKAFNAINFEKEFVTSTLEVKPRGFLMIHFPHAVKWIRDTKAFAWLQESTFIGRIFPKVHASPLLAAQQVERNITVILADEEKAKDSEVKAIIQKSVEVATNLLGHYASTTSPATKANGWMDIANNLQRFVPAAPQKPEEPKTPEKPEEEVPALPTNQAIEPEVVTTPEKKADDAQTVVTTPVTPQVTTTVATPDAPIKKKAEKEEVVEKKPKTTRRKQQKPTRNAKPATNQAPSTPTKKQAEKK